MTYDEIENVYNAVKHIAKLAETEASLIMGANVLPIKELSTRLTEKMPISKELLKVLSTKEAERIM